jgi:hypothetical protein
LVGNAEGKGHLGTPRRRWEDNIRVVLKEIGWEGVDWMHLAQDRDWWRTVVKTVLKFRVTKKAKNFLTPLYGVR